MVEFTHPAMLLGLPAVFVPAIIHLVNRRGAGTGAG